MSQQQIEADMPELPDVAAEAGFKRDDEGGLDFFREYTDGDYLISVYHLTLDSESPYWVRLHTSDYTHLHDVRAGCINSAQDGIGFLATQADDMAASAEEVVA